MAKKRPAPRFEVLINGQLPLLRPTIAILGQGLVVSLAGIALGVASLITVLSVVNGFEKEIRARILRVVPHVDIRGAPALATLDTAWMTCLVRAPPDTSWRAGCSKATHLFTPPGFFLARR